MKWKNHTPDRENEPYIVYYVEGSVLWVVVFTITLITGMIFSMWYSAVVSRKAGIIAGVISLAVAVLAFLMIIRSGKKARRTPVLTVSEDAIVYTPVFGSMEVITWDQVLDFETRSAPRSGTSLILTVSRPGGKTQTIPLSLPNTNESALLDSLYRFRRLYRAKNKGNESIPLIR